MVGTDEEGRRGGPVQTGNDSQCFSRFVFFRIEYYQTVCYGRPRNLSQWILEEREGSIPKGP